MTEKLIISWSRILWLRQIWKSWTIKLGGKWILRRAAPHLSQINPGRLLQSNQPGLSNLRLLDNLNKVGKISLRDNRGTTKEMMIWSQFWLLIPNNLRPMRQMMMMMNGLKLWNMIRRYIGRRKWPGKGEKKKTNWNLKESWIGRCRRERGRKSRRSMRKWSMSKHSRKI